MNQLLSRRLRIWRRSPSSFARKVFDRLFGPDMSWLSKSRDDYPVGSWQWLALSEIHYGGFKVGVESNANRGGDRMSPLFHGYGHAYEEFIKFLFARRNDPLTIIEVGILNGSGLAIWCDLFPNSRIIGLDIDLRNFQSNRHFLDSVGAFSLNQPEVYEFDQLDPVKAARTLDKVLGSAKVEMVIDDGCHSIESIRLTFEALAPRMSPNSIYFIEDNFDTYDDLAPNNGYLRWFQRGEMTIAASKAFF